jgi:hypothetical protein
MQIWSVAIIVLVFVSAYFRIGSWRLRYTCHCPCRYPILVFVFPVVFTHSFSHSFPRYRSRCLAALFAALLLVAIVQLRYRPRHRKLAGATVDGLD